MALLLPRLALASRKESTDGTPDRHMVIEMATDLRMVETEAMVVGMTNLLIAALQDHHTANLCNCLPALTSTLETFCSTSLPPTLSESLLNLVILSLQSLLLMLED